MKLIAALIAAIAGSSVLVACSSQLKHPNENPAEKTQALAAATVAPTTGAGAGGGAKLPSVQAPSPVQAGRYLVIVGGCNDCHTPGFAATGGKIPETLW